MSLGQVGDVDVITDGGAVFRGVIVAEDGEVGPTADSDLCEVREEIVGDAKGIFAEGTAGMGAGGIEIAERGSFPGGICGHKVFNDVFADDLCSSVGIRWPTRADFFQSARRTIQGSVNGTWDGNHVGKTRRIAIHSCRRRKYDCFNASLFHRPKQIYRATNINTIIFQWNLSTLPNSLTNQSPALDEH